MMAMTINQLIITLWCWSQLTVAIVMVVLERFCREVVTFFFRVVPVKYFLKMLGFPSRMPKCSEEDMDLERDAIGLITSRGYPCEEHFAETPDGFIIGLQRIPYVSSGNDGADCCDREDDDGECKGVVLILHGFMQSSEAFLTRKNPSDSLAFVLSDAGYDVWLGNNRGNKYSYKHINHKPNQEEYWDWSLDEMIRYDLPTMINYVAKASGAAKITLVGFSQGTAQSFACLGSNAEVASKVSLFVALAPVSTVRGFSNPIVDSLAKSRPDFIFLLFGKKAMLPSTLFWRKMLHRPLFVKTIDYAIKFLFGWHAHLISPEEKPMLYSHIYSYSSVKSVVHWFQIISRGRFQMFDESLSHAHTNTPNTTTNTHQQHGRTHYSGHHMPTYQLSQLMCKVACFYGGKDNLPNTTEVLSQIPKDKAVYVHCEPEYEHLDFMWAKNTSTKIYPKILEQIQLHSHSNPRSAPTNIKHSVHSHSTPASFTHRGR